MAKLLACALNASGGPSTEFDPEDPTAKAILAGTSIDVVEMDAASNNSVDDIRELRENVALAPMQGGRRIYILDEAHMLSASAWNAFLKTLEEPPSHVVFVLATTEAHKVPATIVDRCHRFDFQRPSLEQIAGVLRRVAAEEQIELPEPAVGMLARSATGSFRDALGTLEQLVTYGGSQVQLDDVRDILGVADAELVLDATDALAERDPRAALLAVQRLSTRAATSPSSCATCRPTCATCSWCRRSARCPTRSRSPPSTPTAWRPRPSASPRARSCARSTSWPAAIAAVKDGSEPRIQLEMALLKATQPQADLSLQALMFRIEQLEARLGFRAGGAGRRSAERPAGEAAAPSPAPARRRRVAVGGGRDGPQAEAEPLPRRSARWSWNSCRRSGRRSPRRSPRRTGCSARRSARPRPMAIEAERLTVAFPPDAAFVKKKAEANRDLVQRALRGLTGHTLAVGYELREDALPAGPELLGEEELIERLRAEFAAEEVFDEEEASRWRQPNMNAMLKQVQKMQADMAKAQEELKNEVVEASAGGGMVTVKVSGDLEVRELRIDPQAVDPDDVELLQDMVLAAVNEAIRAAQELAASKMNAAAGGLAGPGGLGGLGLPGF